MRFRKKRMLARCHLTAVRDPHFAPDTRTQIWFRLDLIEHLSRLIHVQQLRGRRLRDSHFRSKDLLERVSNQNAEIKRLRGLGRHA